MRCLALTALIVTILLFHIVPAFAQVKQGMQPRGQRVSGDDCFKTFNNSFRGDTLPARLNAMLVLNDSSILLAGSELTHDNSLVTQLGLLVTASKKGEIVNARHIIYKNDADLIKIIKQQDGGVVIAGSASNGADYATVFSRYDKKLNLQWERFIKPPGFYSCTSDSSGNTYFASLAGQTPADQRIIITKLAPDGQVSYRYALHHNNPSLNYGLYGSMCFYNNLLYTTMECSISPNWYTLLLCINPAGGTIVWSQLMGSPDAVNLETIDQLFVNNNKLYMIGNTNRTSFTGTTLVEMDGNGNVTAAKQLSGAGIQSSLLFQPTPDGKFLATGTGYDLNVSAAEMLRMFLRFDPALAIINSNKYATAATSNAVGITAANDGYLYEAGNNFIPSVNTPGFYLRKMEPTGKTGSCATDTFPLIIAGITVTNNRMLMTSTAETYTSTPLVREEHPALVDLTDQSCLSKTTCDALYLSGPAAICDTSVFTVTAHRSAGCTAVINWKFDPTIVQLINQTDTSISLKFYKPGNTMLAAAAFNGCRILLDSVMLKAGSDLQINLGPNTSICTNSALLLHAPPGFSRYQWQDGSTDSTFNVTLPGLYYVTAQPACGIAVSDTILITAASPTSVPHNFLPADTSFCPYQRLQVAATGSFKDYNWNTGQQTASIEIDHTGMYTLTVTDQYGCAGKDTIVISPKDCAKGIFFPTAFSPNQDGKNDTYRPLVNGQLISYSFQIYNRNGQLIFSSASFRQAWDGKLSGKYQEAGTYIWQCSWQFINQNKEFQKGFCELIK